MVSNVSEVEEKSQNFYPKQVSAVKKKKSNI